MISTWGQCLGSGHFDTVPSAKLKELDPSTVIGWKLKMSKNVSIVLLSHKDCYEKVHSNKKGMYSRSACCCS